MRQFIDTITMNEPKRLIRSLIWSSISALFKGLPFSFLFATIWLLFEPLSRGDSPDISKILLLTGIMFCTLIAQFFITRKTELTANGDTYDLIADGRVKLGEHLRKLSMGFYRGQDPGDIVAVLLQDYQNIELVISHTLPSVVAAIIVPSITLTALFFLDWKMALITTAVLPLAIPIIIITRIMAIKLGKKHMAGKVDLTSTVLDFVQGFKAIKAFNLQKEKLEEFEEKVETFRKESIALEGGIAPTVIFGHFIIQAGFVAIILCGITFLLNGDLSVFHFLVFLVVGGRLYDPLANALIYLALMNYLALSGKNIEKTLATPTLPESESDNTPKDTTIVFDKVSFSYGTTSVLNEISFTAAPNTITALVGPSGSGKTTITRLIARFWDIEKGKISFGGHSVKELSTEQLLSQIRMVFQDVYLFNDSIMENIRMGCEGANEVQVIKAAKRAQCHDFIMSLPEKYETLAGEGGCRLSGGEKQRISIARALLKNAPVILLDEATASLDPENEFQIQQALTELVSNKTIILIAHKLKTIINADQIIVLDKGEIVERGRHNDLLDKQGLYASLWEQQQKVKGWRFHAATPPKLVTESQLI